MCAYWRYVRYTIPNDVNHSAHRTHAIEIRMHVYMCV